MKTRAFICIDFPDEIIKEIARIQNILQNKKFTGKITEPENLHLTLKFIGEIDDEILKQIQTKLSKIKFPEFEAKLQEAGTFSYRKSLRIAWIRVGGKQILELQKQIDEVLSEIFPKEDRFMSHLTIARIKYVKDKQSFKDYVKQLTVKPLKFKVNSFKLKSSELKPMGPVYTTIKEFDLIT